jgi:hypothetical protein
VHSDRTLPERQQALRPDSQDEPPPETGSRNSSASVRKSAFVTRQSVEPPPDFEIEAGLCRSKYASVFVRMHAELCRDLRRHARLRLNLDLNLNLNLVLYPALNHALFEKPFQKSFQKPFEASFGSSFGFK